MTYGPAIELQLPKAGIQDGHVSLPKGTKSRTINMCNDGEQGLNRGSTPIADVSPTVEEALGKLG